MWLALEQLGVRYGARTVVAGVSLTLARGDIGVLLGPSGCGKTSLLRAVAGLVPAASGRVRMDQRVLGDAEAGVHVPAEQRQVGMVFQDHALFPHLSVAENVAFGLHRQPREAQRARVDEMLALVGLPGQGAQAPHQLSGGQQQRVALARALAPAPQLLLLDEPFSSLDADLRERLAQEVRRILKASGTTALAVTHDQLEAFAVGDQVGVMHAGRLHQWDTPYAIYHRPTTRFVAGFVGNGVFAPARIERHAGGARVHTALGVHEDTGSCPLGAERCDVLLRADDILHDDASPVQARIERKAFRGAEFLYTLRLTSGEQVLALVPSHHDHAVGEWVGIRADLSHVVTFEPEPEPDPPCDVPPASGSQASKPRSTGALPGNT